MEQTSTINNILSKQYNNKNKIIQLYQQSKINKKLIKRLIRIIYLLNNKVKVYTGKKNGLYYFTKNNNKIYL